MKTSKASAALWANANRRNAARIGLGDPADAKHEILTIKSLIQSVGKNPAALELLASRAHELTDAQRMAALRAYAPPKEPKARKPKAARVEPTAALNARSRLAGFPLRGFHSGAQT